MNTKQRHARVGDLFLRVCDLSEENRFRILDGACADEPELRAEVEALLAEDTRVTGLLADRADRRRCVSSRRLRTPRA